MCYIILSSSKQVRLSFHLGIQCLEETHPRTKGQFALFLVYLTQAMLTHHINRCKDRGIGGRVELRGLKNTVWGSWKDLVICLKHLQYFKNGAIWGNVLRFGQGLSKGEYISLFSYSSDKISNVSDFGVGSFIAVHSLGEQFIMVGGGPMTGVWGRWLMLHPQSGSRESQMLSLSGLSPFCSAQITSP